MQKSGLEGGRVDEIGKHEGGQGKIKSHVRGGDFNLFQTTQRLFGGRHGEHKGFDLTRAVAVLLSRRPV